MSSRFLTVYQKMILPSLYLNRKYYKGSVPCPLSKDNHFSILRDDSMFSPASPGDHCLIKMFITPSNFPFNSFLIALGIKSQLLINVNALNDCPNSPNPSQATLSFPQLAPALTLPFFLFLGCNNLFSPQGGLPSFYLPGLCLTSFFSTFMSQFLNILILINILPPSPNYFPSHYSFSSS